LETQFLIPNNKCGLLIGLVVDKILRPLVALRLNIKVPSLKIFIQNQQEITIGLIIDLKFTSGRKFQDYGKLKWRINAILMKNKF